MLKAFSCALILASLFFASLVRASPVPPEIHEKEVIPVEKEDMAVLLYLAEQEKCRLTVPPDVTLSPLVIVRDKKDQTFGTVPLTIKIDWCNYLLTLEGTVRYTHAVTPPPPPSLWVPKLKLFGGFALAQTFSEGLSKGTTVGVIGHILKYKGAYPFAYLGTTGIGAGLGYYVTPTMGFDVGYMYTYTGKHEPILGVSLALF